jgi:small-conductance mechanosensitive channel
MGDFLTRLFGTSPRLLYGNSIAEWIGAGIIVVGVWAALLTLRQAISAHYRDYVGPRRPTPIRLFGSLVGSTRQFAFFAVALYAAKESLALPAAAQRSSANCVLILLLVQAGIWLRRALRFYLELKERERGPDRLFAGSLDVINFVAGILIWSLVILVALENLGINITALLAGLGVGGVALALALQNILGDLFASLSIALDKPFVVGDSLTIDTFTGKVENIGIKTTRLRSETGEQIILSNADILKSRVRNFSRAAELRTLVTLRVAYDTPSERLQAIPKVLEEVIRTQPHARFERCHLVKLGESALHYELSYFGERPDLNPLLDLQQAVNLRVIEEFRRLGIEFAYPTQRILGLA